jgi:hypothetical protein
MMQVTVLSLSLGLVGVERALLDLDLDLVWMLYEMASKVCLGLNKPEHGKYPFLSRVLGVKC